MQRNYQKGIDKDFWGGQKFLAPSKNISYNTEVFDLFMTPDDKVSLQDVMELQKYRYEGTEYDANLAKIQK